MTNGSHWLMATAGEVALCRLTTCSVRARGPPRTAGAGSYWSTILTSRSEASLAAVAARASPRSRTTQRKSSPRRALKAGRYSPTSSPAAPMRSTGTVSPTSSRCRCKVSTDARASSESDAALPTPGARPPSSCTSTTWLPENSFSRRASAVATSVLPSRPGAPVTPIVVDVLAITSPLAIFASRLLSTREKASSTFALCRKNCSKTDLSTASRRALREAVTVAARWPPSSSDISPKNSPGPSRLTIRLVALGADRVAAAVGHLDEPPGQRFELVTVEGAEQGDLGENLDAPGDRRRAHPASGLRLIAGPRQALSAARSGTRDGGAGRREHPLRFDSAPLNRALHWPPRAAANSCPL